MVVGIISEYNPFHNGHLYQIEKIREEFGEDTVIIAVMSGNYVQRGGVAIADKGLRARCAVLCGVNLVLELPFPFSMSSAEFFARAAISIFDSLQCVDYISFGSESGDAELLASIARTMLTKEYSRALDELLANPDNRGIGHPRLCEMALSNLGSVSSGPIELTPNNILAIEYIKALISLNSNIKPHTVKRVANSFSSVEIVSGNVQSATAIRNIALKNNISALDYIPNTTKNLFLEACESGDFPCNDEALSTAVISSFRINPPDVGDSIHDATGGLYNRLRELSFRENTIDNLVRSAESKKFTRARVRRAVFNSLLGVTSSHFDELPAYTQLLATDAQGRSILKALKKRGGISILTKPSDVDALSDISRRQKALSDKADSVFQLTKPIPKNGNTALLFTPYVKK